MSVPIQTAPPFETSLDIPVVPPTAIVQEPLISNEPSTAEPPASASPEAKAEEVSVNFYEDVAKEGADLVENQPKEGQVAVEGKGKGNGHLSSKLESLQKEVTYLLEKNADLKAALEKLEGPEWKQIMENGVAGALEVSGYEFFMFKTILEGRHASTGSTKILLEAEEENEGEGEGEGEWLGKEMRLSKEDRDALKELSIELDSEEKKEELRSELDSLKQENDALKSQLKESEGACEEELKKLKEAAAELQRLDPKGEEFQAIRNILKDQLISTDGEGLLEAEGGKERELRDKRESLRRQNAALEAQIEEAGGVCQKELVKVTEEAIRELDQKDPNSEEFQITRQVLRVRVMMMKWERPLQAEREKNFSLTAQLGKSEARKAELTKLTEATIAEVRRMDPTNGEEKFKTIREILISTDRESLPEGKEDEDEKLATRRELEYLRSKMLANFSLEKLKRFGETVFTELERMDPDGEVVQKVLEYAKLHLIDAVIGLVEGEGELEAERVDPDGAPLLQRVHVSAKDQLKAGEDRSQADLVEKLKRLEAELDSLRKEKEKLSTLLQGLDAAREEEFRRVGDVLQRRFGAQIDMIKQTGAKDGLLDAELELVGGEDESDFAPLDLSLAASDSPRERKLNGARKGLLEQSVESISSESEAVEEKLSSYAEALFVQLAEFLDNQLGELVLADYQEKERSTYELMILKAQRDDLRAQLEDLRATGKLKDTIEHYEKRLSEFATDRDAIGTRITSLEALLRGEFLGARVPVLSLEG